MKHLFLPQQYEARNQLQEKKKKKKKRAKKTNPWRLNDILLNIQWIIEEIKEEI